MTTWPIGTGVTSIDGTVYPWSTIAPGDRLEIAAGTRDYLRIDNLSGSSGDPIIIVNHGGKVTFDGTLWGGAPRDFGVRFHNCEYIWMSGTGSEHLFGFYCENHDNCGIWFYDECSHIELDHVEINGSWETPGDDTTVGVCIRAYYYDVSDYHFHHIYTRNIGAAHYYLNTLQSHGGMDATNGEFHDLWMIEGGTDGLQLRRWFGDLHVYRNYASGMGQLCATPGYTAQGGAGYIIGEDTAGIWEHNRAIDCDRAIMGLAMDGAEVRYNHCEDCGGIRSEGGIRVFTDGNGIDIHHNTVVNSDDYGVKSKSGDNDGIVRDNIACGSGGDDIDSDYSVVSDNIIGTTASQNFRPGDPLRHLTSSSPAVGAAGDGSDCGRFDYN